MAARVNVRIAGSLRERVSARDAIETCSGYRDLYVQSIGTDKNYCQIHNFFGFSLPTLFNVQVCVCPKKISIFATDLLSFFSLDDYEPPNVSFFYFCNLPMLQQNLTSQYTRFAHISFYCLVARRGARARRMLRLCFRRFNRALKIDRIVYTV